MKKALKIIGVIVLLLVVFIASAPFLFRGTLEKILKRTINENLNATVEWQDLDVSLFSSFPDASLTLNNFSVINKAPFEGDTLASGKSLKLDMGVMQLLNKSDEPIKVDALKLDEAFINIRLDSIGNTNYDVAIKDDSPVATEDESAGGFSFQMKEYEIINSRVNYLDETSGIYLALTNLQHKGTGDLSAAVSNLDTKTTGEVTFRMGESEYLSNNKVILDAVIKMDLENMKFTFLENEAKINELPLTFDGYVKVNETNNEVDITFKTPSSDFKNFLAVIPKEYVKEIDQVKTTGDFVVNGIIKGIVDEERIPTLDITITSNNASFKYPDLPKTVQDISINAQLKNETGLLKDTYLNLPKLTFRIDNEPFSLNGSVKRLMENPYVDMQAKGTLNLANIEKVLPIEIEQNLSGVFKADISAKFDMESVEKEQYQNINASGNASLTGFNYTDASFKNDIKITNAMLSMDPSAIRLQELNLISGSTDVKASGTIENLIPFLMSKQDLKGRFAVQSNKFNVNDFMSAENATAEKKEGAAKTPKKTSTAEAVKIPDFLDATLDFNASTVVYDNLELKNVKGTAIIQNETISIKNLTSDIFGGNIALSGNVSTINEIPTFNVNLDLSKIDIDQSFEKLEMLQFLAPIAKALQGSLNTKFNLSGQLTNDLSPILTSLAGDALAEIITAEVDPSKTPLLSKLGDKVAFLDLSKLSLKDVSTVLTFNNGKINVKPFNFDVKGINVAVGGSHGLDQSMDYNLTMDIPAKYLGGEVTKLLQKLDPKEAEEMHIALPIGLKGTFANPQISMNTQTAISSLTAKLIDKQKEKLKEKGTDILGGLIKNATTKKDSTSTTTQTNTGTNTTTKTQQNTEVIKNVLGGILGGRNKKKDTTKTGGGN